MAPRTPRFETALAASEADIRAAQTLRYEVFVEELGGDGPLVDHRNRLERDAFDPYYDHLLLFDRARQDNQVVGVYRLLSSDKEPHVGQYYCDDEYDLSRLKQSGRRLLELGRSCLHADYRGGSAMLTLWQALAGYIQARDIKVLFGVASFHGTDIAALAPSLSMLHHKFLAPTDLRVRARPENFQPMDLISPETIDRVAAMRAVPQLIKAYLRLGGFVGEGAFVDHAFNTTDVCLLMDVTRLNPKQAALYAPSVQA